MIYFIRHGESEANIDKIFSNKGFKHLLTENGVNQAVTLANQLQNKKINRIISSPVLRAIQTASIISERLGIQTFEIHEYLREYDVGDLEGKSDTNSWKQYFDNENSWKNENARHYRLPNGESFIEIQKRFSSFITPIISNKSTDEKNTLIVTHGGLLKIGLPAICHNIDYIFTCNNPISNCELICCDIINNECKCLIWGNKVLK